VIAGIDMLLVIPVLCVINSTESMDNKYHDLKATMKETIAVMSEWLAVLKDATGLAPSVIKKKLLPPSDVYLTHKKF
jgi:hypothetical protein